MKNNKNLYFDQGIGYEEESFEDSDDINHQFNPYMQNLNKAKTFNTKGMGMMGMGYGKKSPLKRDIYGNIDLDRDKPKEIDPYNVDIAKSKEIKDVDDDSLAFNFEEDEDDEEKEAAKKEKEKEKKKKKRRGVLDLLEEDLENEKKLKEEEELKKRKQEELIEKRLKQNEKDEKRKATEEDEDDEDKYNDFNEEFSEHKSETSLVKNQKTVNEDNDVTENDDIHKSENVSKLKESNALSESIAASIIQQPKMERIDPSLMDQYLKNKGNKIDFNLPKEEIGKDDSNKDKDSDKKDNDNDDEPIEDEYDVEEKLPMNDSNSKDNTNNNNKPQPSKEDDDDEEQGYNDFEESAVSKTINNPFDESSKKMRVSNRMDTGSELSERIKKMINSNDSNVLNSSLNANEYKFDERDQIVEESVHSEKIPSVNDTHSVNKSPHVEKEISKSPNTRYEPVQDEHKYKNVNIEELIKNEIQRQMSSQQNPYQNLNNNNNANDYKQNSYLNQFSKTNPSGIQEAQREMQNIDFMKTKLIPLKTFDLQLLKTSKTEQFTYNKQPAIKEKQLFEKLKYDSMLKEERTLRTIVETELKKIKAINKELEKQVRELQSIKEENLNLKKNCATDEELLDKMRSDYEGLKEDYEKELKQIQKAIEEREAKKSEHKINELEKKYQMNLLKMQYEMESKTSDIEHLKTQNEVLTEENNKLKTNSDKDEEIQKLKQENFVLHEKCNKLEKDNETLEVENHKLKLFSNQSQSKFNPIMSSSMQQQNDGKQSVDKNNYINVYNTNSQILNYESKDKDIPNTNQSISGKKDKYLGPLSVFDQLLYDREISSQEKLLLSYVKEIEHLNKEIAFLKSIPTGGNQRQSQLMNGNNINNNSTSVLSNNYVNPQQSSNVKINPSLQESAEIQIRKLQKFLTESNSNDSDIPMNKLMLMEKEFKKLQDNSSQNEISFENYINVMKWLNVPLTSNELIEIFNNFPRIKGNRIRMNDFINAINSKSPSSFYMQSDPSYLNTLEAKLLKSQNRVKELEKFILVNSTECDEYKNQIVSFKEENSKLKEKINDLNAKILNYFLFREEKNISNPDVIQMKEKLKSFETTNNNNTKLMTEKFEEYEKRINDLKNEYDSKTKAFYLEKEKLKETINKLTTEKNEMQSQCELKENELNSEIKTLNGKLEKYKKNYKLLSTQKDNLIKENEKVLGCLQDKGITPDKILTFVKSYDEVQLLLKKIEELEKKNEDKEERYKQLCIKANTNYFNKEIENLTKKYEGEKKELLNVLSIRNKEIHVIKKEFSEIVKELEIFKATGKFK